MTTYFLYQFTDNSFHTVNLKAPMNVYIKQAEKVTENINDVVCRWVVRKSNHRTFIAHSETIQGAGEVMIVEKG
jgi:hypothetical protein